MVTSPSGATTVTTPVTPDPSVLTTEQLRREITWVKDLLQQEVKCKDEVMAARLTAMDRAIVLFQELTDSLPDLWKQEVNHLKELHHARFDTIAIQFKERDTRIEQIAQLNKTANEVSAKQNETSINAALQAQEKASGKQTETLTESNRKSEERFRDQLDKGLEVNKETIKTVETRVESLKERLDKIEGRSSGIGTLAGWIAAAIASIVGIVGLIIKG